MTLNIPKIAYLCLVWAFYLGLVGFALNVAGILLIIGTVLYLIS